MNVSLTPSLEQFVRDQAKSGGYNNSSEVVREALRLLKRVEDHRALQMDRLRDAVRAGDEALANGDHTEINTDEALDAIFAKI